MTKPYRWFIAMTLPFIILLGCNNRTNTPSAPGPAPAAFTATTTPTLMVSLTATPSPTLTLSPTPTMTSTMTSTMTWVYTATPTTTPHVTPVVTIPPTGILFQAYVSLNATTYLQLWLNGVPDDTAAVTLASPVGPVHYHNSGSGIYYPDSTITYIPGQSYTLTAITSGGTATATLIAPGGNMTVSPDGSTATWDVEGNEDWIKVTQAGGPYLGTYRSYDFTTDMDSPAAIPSSAYPTLGNYGVLVVPQNTTFNVTGAMPGSRYTVNEYAGSTVTK